MGRETIAAAVSQMIKPHPSRGSSRRHHTTHDHLILTVANGDGATLDAQFVVFESAGQRRATTAMPEGASGAQGAGQPIEDGLPRRDKRRVDGVLEDRRRCVSPIAFPMHSPDNDALVESETQRTESARARTVSGTSSLALGRRGRARFP